MAYLVNPDRKALGFGVKSCPLLLSTISHLKISSWFDLVEIEVLTMTHQVTVQSELPKL